MGNLPVRRDSPGTGEDTPRSWCALARQGVTAFASGRLARFSAALQLGFAVMLLTIAWQTGVQPAVDAAHYRHYTARSEATIAASWIALDFETASDAPYWTLRARGTPCMVVNVIGDWGAPFQRAFCGARFPLSNLMATHRPPDLFTGAPFAWQRDRRGFAVPELRLDTAAHDWLVAHAPDDPGASVDPPRNALEEFQRDLDQPVEQAIAGWSVPVPTLAVALDPRHPDDVVPAAFAITKLNGHSDPGVALFAAMLGLLLWFVGMAMLMQGLPRAPMVFAAVVPLLALPWWGEQMPLAAARLDSHVGTLIAVMLDGFENRQRLHATTPGNAQLATAERIVWSLDNSMYAKSFEALTFEPPKPSPIDPDVALAALAHSVAAQVRRFDVQQQRALFDRLQYDKRADCRGAGLAFLQAAGDAMRDQDVAEAARGFLDAWTTPPVDLPQPDDAAFDERVRLYQSLTDVADNGIAQGARSIAERALAERASSAHSKAQ